jgi:hypothetical protein
VSVDSEKKMIVVTDSNGREVVLDFTDTLPVISEPHHQLHNGNMFSAFVTGTLASAAKIELALSVPDGIRIHLKVSYRASDKASFTLTEDVADLAAGVAFIPVNRNRPSTTTSIATAKTGTPAAAMTYTGGTVLFGDLFGGAGASQPGGLGEFSTEWILKDGADTVLTLLSSANNNACSMSVNFYQKDLNGG